MFGSCFAVARAQATLPPCDRGVGMASGYEKAACGVDPNDGWGEPRPIDRFWEALAIGFGVVPNWPTVSAVFALVRVMLS